MPNVASKVAKRSGVSNTEPGDFLTSIVPLVCGSQHVPPFKSKGQTPVGHGEFVADAPPTPQQLLPISQQLIPIPVWFLLRCHVVNVMHLRLHPLVLLWFVFWLLVQTYQKAEARVLRRTTWLLGVWDTYTVQSGSEAG